MHPRPHRRVPDRTADAGDAVVSSPAIGATDSGKPIPTATPAEGPRVAHERIGIAVGPGLGGPLLRAGIGGYRVNPLEIQPAKIHCPPSREDWLSRERLNTWLDRASAGRLGLIVAEAGFGKTTLLADWALHSRRLTTWYRLESDDRDWLTFIRHLVAGGRELDPEFAPDTFRLLHSLGPGGPSPADLTASIARELAAFGAASPTGLTLLIDDYHVVDGHPDTDPIVRALLDRTGPGFSVVIATRSMPRFSVGRLRARGGVMTIDGEALCFDMDETSRLFRDAYRRPLDEDVVSDLHDRTEGWAALLTLVRTGLEDRESSDPRALVAGLDASRGDLYEFLAEEVMGSLSPELQHFLTRVSVLMAVDVDSAMLVDDRPADAIAASIRESERIGLLTRPDRESPHRFHHLVREFLAARLEDEIGAEAVRTLHRSIADRVRNDDWYAAAWHYLQAGDKENCSIVIDGALDQVIALGQFDQARQFLIPDAGDPSRPAALIIGSRLDLARGDLGRATHSARAAVAAADPGSALRGAALLNAAAMRGVTGVDSEGESLAKQALEYPLTPTQRFVAEASIALRHASEEGDLKAVVEILQSMAAAQEQAGQVRYVGVSRSNLAGVLIWLGEFEWALQEAKKAETALGGLESPSIERVAATSARAIALAHLGRLEAARVVLAGARGDGSPLSASELASEIAHVEAALGNFEYAARAVTAINPDGSGAYGPIATYWRGIVSLRKGDPQSALPLADQAVALPIADAAGKLRAHLLRARVARALAEKDAPARAAEALRIARAQRAPFAAYQAELLLLLCEGRDLNSAVVSVGPNTIGLSLLAEEVSDQLATLSDAAIQVVQAEAALRPDRWRSALWLTIDKGSPAAPEASRLLASIGDRGDAERLRVIATGRRQLRPDALRITERLARLVYVEDLGSVGISLGGEHLPRGIRRKVLALVCFLSSRPSLAASRDEVLDALWPELAPEAAGNSLHQAIYHWRRLLEPDFREWASANYIAFDGEVVNLHPNLVDTASRECWRIVKSADINQNRADRLLDVYTGRYALDFSYEDWATDYRNSLHAAVLSTVEVEVKRSRLGGDIDRAILLAQRILALDPSADSIELELVLAYRSSGRHAAAAEQYSHYAAFAQNELGAEVPPLDDLS